MAFKDAPTESEIADFLAMRGSRGKTKRSVREALDADCLPGLRLRAPIEVEASRGPVGGTRMRVTIAVIVMSIGAGIGALGQYTISNSDLELKVVEMAEMTIAKLGSLRSNGSFKP